MHIGHPKLIALTLRVVVSSGGIQPRSTTTFVNVSIGAAGATKRFPYVSSQLAVVSCCREETYRVGRGCCRACHGCRLGSTRAVRLLFRPDLVAGRQIDRLREQQRRPRRRELGRPLCNERRRDERAEAHEYRWRRNIAPSSFAVLVTGRKANRVR